MRLQTWHFQSQLRGFWGGGVSARMEALVVLLEGAEERCVFVGWGARVLVGFREVGRDFVGEDKGGLRVRRGEKGDGGMARREDL